MNFLYDPLGVMAFFLLAVPVAMALYLIRRALWPKSEPKHKLFFWLGAGTPFALFLFCLPVLAPSAGLPTLFVICGIWWLVTFVASKVMKRVLQMDGQIRKLVTIFVFLGFLVFPLFYAFVLPQMEHDAAVRAALEEAKAHGEQIARADHGSANAQFMLGHNYATGEGGVEQDFEQAAKWYRMAAERGDAEAQAALGRLYANGQGVPQEDTEAYFWLTLALARSNDENKGWITALRDKTAVYMDRAEVRAAEKRAKAWQPRK